MKPEAAGLRTFWYGTPLPVKLALALNGARIADADAAALLSPTCRVFVSVNSSPALPQTCMSYDALKDEFKYEWKIPKNTAPAAVTITVTVKNADGTTNATKLTTVALTK